MMTVDNIGTVCAGMQEDQIWTLAVNDLMDSTKM